MRDGPGVRGGAGPVGEHRGDGEGGWGAGVPLCVEGEGEVGGHVELWDGGDDGVARLGSWEKVEE